ncbi:hypothetical protein ASPBRDRAFT_634480 [Aspergillus brasiliensis CBS 101740]|uniref:Uncharacterized protein n=1 Tax=Aspergillus brasiliensis (strain CBS 101740 / IMI 381727 / IBT 21946) TaxID=767769 RepID=A0A1L9UGD9_ASPBC|nr:hypothetical protein ASPBRDRAFT_634480 [Aspergillus brasiliensis CBS 101740]
MCILISAYPGVMSHVLFSKFSLLHLAFEASDQACIIPFVSLKIYRLGGFPKRGGGCLLFLLAFYACIHIESSRGVVWGRVMCMGACFDPPSQGMIALPRMAYVPSYAVSSLFSSLRVLASHLALALALASLCTGQ